MNTQPCIKENKVGVIVTPEQATLDFLYANTVLVIPDFWHYCDRNIHTLYDYHKRFGYPNTIEYRIYEGANHGFDGDYGTKYSGMGTTPRNCAILEIDLDTWAKHIVASGELLPPEKEKEFYKNCVSRGVSYGSHNTKYRDMAAKDIEAFLKQMKIIN